MAFDDSTIAQFVFDRDPALNLGLLVKELDAALERSGAGRRIITWDCDDVAFLDLDAVRFTLSYTGEAAVGLPASLMISVGPGPNRRHDPADRRRYEGLCQVIAERLRSRFAPRETLWHQVAGPVTTDLVDDLFTRLPDLANGAPKTLTRRSAPAEAIRAFPEAEEGMPVSFVEKAIAIKAAKAERARALGHAQPAGDAPLPANDTTAANGPDLRRVRAALYPEADTPPENVRMRLAASALDVTLMVVYLPMGAAMLTRSLLRGGDVNASARVTALTCTMLGIAHMLGLSPAGLTI
ncbi:hypothetical protein C0V75_06825 [Tabrizicola sp. TH137]|uniref:hypothetical protein n=1 Tax=Tabrizicola sp. TH137 TaxID=2067452 RepID=UPI000C7D8BA9|nr:hypothetical protein [Tabrizicola sp. TH137]PLL13126.1 hypothetical protein C0V75_06825 [Tabrizicola sp. TH137]